MATKVDVGPTAFPGVLDAAHVEGLRAFYADNAPEKLGQVLCRGASCCQWLTIGLARRMCSAHACQLMVDCHVLLSDIICGVGFCRWRLRSPSLVPESGLPWPPSTQPSTWQRSAPRPSEV
jgi:hypothetical protein